MKRGKRYRSILEKIDKNKLYSPWEALSLIKEISNANFDEAVEVAIRLAIDPKKADQQVRGTVILPHGTGKIPKVLVFAKGEKVKEAEKAGAEIVGGEDLAEKIKDGFLDFDVAIATPDMMRVVGRLGKILGPRGLMPNPKTGTVTFEVGKAIQDAKKGKVEYRTDKYAIVHLILGKVSFSVKELVENYAILIYEIMKAKPSAAKGKYLRSIHFSSSMGPSVSVDTSIVRDLIEE
ncbi:MAG: 50S ribosomal protein L1 [Actinomycetia bacterium]|nr:50S ribosomal protein L1 [Actinomycetes bacterium]